MYITHTVACVWRSEVNFEELTVPCSHHAGLGQEVRLVFSIFTPERLTGPIAS